MRIKRHFGISERIDELIANLDELGEALHDGDQQVELCEAEFIKPLSILPLSVFAVNNGIQIECSEQSTDVLAYLNTIGFPNGFVDIPEDSKQYLPITRLPPIEQNNVLGKYEDLILANAGSGSYAGSFKFSLKYLTSELVNNVNEHADIDHYWLFAQYYPTMNRECEITIADCGIGYKKSYRGTKYEAKTDKQAIINALEGKSSKRENLRGSGIPSIAKMFVQGYGGKLVIISGKSIIYDKQKERKTYSLKYGWTGSLVSINFNAKKINPYDYVDT